ncbi:hypothetical protein F441_14915 [Phytophthora nicotianae CJ01A1]|uniref:Uncharacterized protein n=2 Tax=Phytophthora nicotianae TaxID=4792 RepID=W2IHA9_PHYNI|nr:hypothetical protein L915_14661 [Phytophthora nicotianae]ETL32912.1 hypothetical protein L916_14567 [Phytophthora nicotianae]ETP09217.1 hypothetical protein F441_14915 [Phytophthora nicotianae CJ01A1]
MKIKKVLPNAASVPQHETDMIINEPGAQGTGARSASQSEDVSICSEGEISDDSDWASSNAFQQEHTTLNLPNSNDPVTTAGTTDQNQFTPYRSDEVNNDVVQGVSVIQYHRLPTLGGIVTPVHQSETHPVEVTRRRAVEHSNHGDAAATEATNTSQNNSIADTTGAEAHETMLSLYPATRDASGPAPFVPSFYVNTLVAFAPSRES